MKIIISPAKQMNVNNPINKDWILNKYSEQIQNALKSLHDKELKKTLRVNDSILKQVNGLHENFDQPITYKAIDLYDGLAFRWMKKPALSNNALEYLNKNLLILSAFYGPITPDTHIKPYRLDFISTLKIDGENLRSFWTIPYSNSISKGEMLLNLASEEFSTMFDKSRYNWIDFEFYESKDGVRKSHSTISKKGRGLMVRYLAENNVIDIEEIKTFNLDGYRFDAKQSSDEKLVFAKYSI